MSFHTNMIGVRMEEGIMAMIQLWFYIQLILSHKYLAEHSRQWNFKFPHSLNFTGQQGMETFKNKNKNKYRNKRQMNDLKISSEIKFSEKSASVPKFAQYEGVILTNYIQTFVWLLL